MLFEKGYTPWNKGTKGVCKSSNTSFKKGMTPWNKGKRGIGGEAHYNWNGGITKISRRVYQMPEYKLWRSTVFKRDNWICQTCGERGTYLEAHHLKAFHLILKEYKVKTLKEAQKCLELWDITNGVTLCKDCHNLTKPGRVGGKKK